MTATTCACGKTLGRRNKSGRCKSCCAKANNANPAVRAAQAKGRDVYFNKPGVREGYRDRINAHIANMSDEERERRREQGRWLYANHATRAEVAKLNRSPEVRSRAKATRIETMLAWCPAHLRDFNAKLVRRGVRLPQRKEMVAAEAERLTRAGLDPDSAARYLQTRGPVYRCTADGRQQIGGTHWRYASRVLDRDGVIELALDRGWQPDAWRRVA